jgi:hypothetical protein
MSDEAPAAVYQHDAHAAPDTEFEPGTFAHLVPGNRGRMLDPRRTPVTIVAVDHATGSFELVVDAFEDRGARWRLALDDVAGFQFERRARRLSPEREDELTALARRFAVTLELDADPIAREETLAALAAERARIAPALAAALGSAPPDLEACVARREGSTAAAQVLGGLLDAAGLAELDASFAETYVSNPASGEIVKGHAVVLAEMGLCAYTGPGVRDPSLFDGTGAKPARRAHILLRLAFAAELMALLGLAEVELFRGAALDGPAAPPRRRSFVAATFAREVARAHFDSPTRAALLVRSKVPVTRLFMTFVETAAMNGRYREAEAVLLCSPGDAAF